MVHLLAKGTHDMSQISREYHVTGVCCMPGYACIGSEEKPLLFPIGQALPR
jgi:hypothetical protein